MTPDDRLGLPRHSRRRESFWALDPVKPVPWPEFGLPSHGFSGTLAMDLGDSLRDPLEQSLRETNALAS